MRIAADGFLDLTDARRLRTPGDPGSPLDPMPMGEALAFLLSHSFPGHRRLVRLPSQRERSHLHHAIWSDAMGERMELVDRVWRALTTPVSPPQHPARPEAIQILEVDGRWAYPLFLDGQITRVLPDGGLPVGSGELPRGVPVIRSGLADP